MDDKVCLQKKQLCASVPNAASLCWPSGHTVLSAQHPVLSDHHPALTAEQLQLTGH